MFKIDQGKEFGKWNDPVSQFLYFESIKYLRSLVFIGDDVVDLCGGNNLLKEIIPHSVNVDIDPEKNPDIVCDVFDYDQKHDLAIIRYALHYFNDYDLIRLIDQVKRLNQRVLIIQFVNEDLKTKYHNSRNELKYFRCADQLRKLLLEFDCLKSINYYVNAEFYLNRLKIKNAIPHIETLKYYYYENPEKISLLRGSQK